MIREAEIRRLAGQWNVDPMIVDLDYVLGCFLASLYRQQWAQAWLFKGGTCLRKCYYADYRFSEDLDFTVTQRLYAHDLERRVTEVIRDAEEMWQIDLASRPMQVETLEDEYGKETYRVRVYYRGPLRRAGDPRAIRLDVTTAEVVVSKPVWREIIHPYSDADLLGGVTILCYGPTEILAEKVRALAGQRRYAIARDLYDLVQLTDRQPVDIAGVIKALPAKMAVKGLPATLPDLERMTGRQKDFEADWGRNLLHVLNPNAYMEFDYAWNKATGFLSEVARRSAAARPRKEGFPI